MQKSVKRQGQWRKSLLSGLRFVFLRFTSYFLSFP